MKLVVTLARDAPYILMDEPLSGLDPIVRNSIIKGLISFVDLEKQTVVITTHEINEVEALLDRVVAIRNGKIVKVVELDELRLNEGVSLVEWMTSIYSDNANQSKEA